MLPIQYARATTQNIEFDPLIDENPNERVIKADKARADNPVIDDGDSSEKVIGLRTRDEKENEDFGYNFEKKPRVIERPNEVSDQLLLAFLLVSSRLMIALSQNMRNQTCEDVSWKSRWPW